jgi:hypothetical protein
MEEKMYLPFIRRKQKGAILEVASGGVINVLTGGTIVIADAAGLTVNGVVIGPAVIANVTATYTEINSLVGQPASASMTSTPGTGTCAVQLTLKDAAGVALTHAVAGFGYLSNSTGLAIAAATSIATLTNGIISQLVAGTTFMFVSSAAGLLGATVVGAGGSYYITLIAPNGKLITTTAIVCN